MQHLNLGIIIVSLILTIPFSLKEGKEFKSKNPNLLPFAWGFFVGYMGVVFSLISAASLFIESTHKYGSAATGMVVLGLIMLLTAFVHIYMIKRNKWAWLVGIVISMNPILWVVNGIYLKNRWHEMGGRSITLATQVLSKKSMTQRYLLTGSAFWAFSVIIFVFMFEPFGSYFSADELAKTFKIIMFPIIIGAGAYILFVKLIRPNAAISISTTEYGITGSIAEHGTSREEAKPIDSQPETPAKPQRTRDSIVEHMVRHNGVLVRVSELEKLNESSERNSSISR